MSEQDKIRLFKTIICEYMLNKSTLLDSDRTNVLSRVSLHKLSVDDYYDMLVTEIREDTARLIFREIKQLIDIYL